MKRLAAVALLVAAFGALLHFWPSGGPSSAAPSMSPNAPAGESRDTPAMDRATSKQAAPASSAASAPANAERPLARQTRIEIRAPQRAVSGETFPMTIEVQAPAGIRRLAFSVTYSKSLLRLLRWTPGAFVQQGGTSVQFEDVSEGSLLVRIERGVVAGAGSIAVLEFEAVARGVSPLGIEDVTYVEDGGDAVHRATAYEGSITIE